jgi:HK97 gp10 family phage protein
MPAKMTINDSLHKKLSEVRMRNALQKSVKQTMYDLMKASMIEAPVDTGNLRRSHSIEVRLGSNTVEGLLKNSANYWQYVQFGTSRMNANDFVTRALSEVAPAEKCSEYFKQRYKE